MLAYQNVAIIYVASANIAANNRGQTVTVREDGRAGGGRAIARKAKARKEGRRKVDGEWRHMNRRLFKKGKDPNAIVTLRFNLIATIFLCLGAWRVSVRVKVSKTFLIRGIKEYKVISFLPSSFVFSFILYKQHGA